MVLDYLKVFSFRGRAELEALGEAVTQRPAGREAQHALAEEVTALVHGEAECRRVVAASRALFGHGRLEELDVSTLAAALAEVPRTVVAGDPPRVVELLAESGLVASRSAARRTIAEGGAYLNNRRVADEHARPAAGDFLHGRWLVLRRGRRQVAGVERVR